MTTKVYGQSDDNVYFEGDYTGQYSNYGQAEEGILLSFSDGTILRIKYGKEGLAIWAVDVYRKGDLLDKIDYCNDEDNDIYSDIVYFKEGIKFVYASCYIERVN
jgi:hypothetical protein